MTKNLYDCLLQLRDTFASDARSCPEFWIDAICVNQTDNAERGAHVTIMSIIYNTAQEVIIWLGLSDDTTHLASDIIKKIGSMWASQRSDLSRRPSKDHKPSVHASGRLLDVLEIPVTDLDMTTDSPLGHLHSKAHWTSVVELFSRSMNHFSFRQNTAHSKQYIQHCTVREH